MRYEGCAIWEKWLRKIKLINIFEPEKEIELEAVIDTGATMLVLPQNVIDKLNLRKMREVKVRYVNNKTEIKSIYGIVTVEMCGRAGEGCVTVSPDGGIFACHELDGFNAYKIGDVFRGIDPEKKKIWSQTCHVDSRNNCRDCWAKYLCGGGCRAHSIKFNKDMSRSFQIECELNKIRFETGIWLYSQIYETNDNSRNTMK